MFYSQVHFLFCVWLTCLSGDDGKILLKNFSFLFHVFKWFFFFFKGGFPNLPCVSGHLRVSLLLDDALFNISRSASMMFWPVCLLTPFFFFFLFCCIIWEDLFWYKVFLFLFRAATNNSEQRHARRVTILRFLRAEENVPSFAIDFVDWSQLNFLMSKETETPPIPLSNKKAGQDVKGGRHSRIFFHLN